MSDSRIPLVVSTLALLFAIAVLIYKSAPTAQAQAQPAQVDIVPLGVANTGNGVRSHVWYYVPSTRSIVICSGQADNAAGAPKCSKSPALF